VKRELAKSAALLLLAVIALTLFGCGGSSAGDSLTKADFIKKGNQACRRGNEERVQAKEQTQKELGLHPGEIANGAQHEQIAEAALAPYEKSTEQLQELVPSEQADKLEPLIKAREEVSEVERQISNSSNAGFGAIIKANKLASEFGLDECSI
jgi:hypothetical protein